MNNDTSSFRIEKLRHERCLSCQQAAFRDANGLVTPVTRLLRLGTSHEALRRMIIRNAHAAAVMVWIDDENPHAADVARRFLAGERELLRLARARTTTIVDLQTFLDIAAELPITVERAAGGELLISAPQAKESLMITGKTAEVLRAYIDDQPVRTQDRLDMTIRRGAPFHQADVSRRAL